MAAQYTRATRRVGAVRRAPPSGNGSRPLVLVVVVAVLLAAAGLWVLRHRGAAPPAPAAATAPASPPHAASPAPSPAPAPKPAPKGAPRADPRAQERFEFYRMLPKAEVPNPPTDKDVRPGPAPPPITVPGTYVLQVGTWPTAAEADRVHARLAQRGIRAEVQDVGAEDRHLYRVRVGPVEDLAALNKARRQLRDAHVAATLQSVGD